MKFYYESDGDKYSETHYVTINSPAGNDVRIDCPSMREAKWLEEQLNRIFAESLAEKDKIIETLGISVKETLAVEVELREKIKELEEKLEFTDAWQNTENLQARIRELEEQLKEERIKRQALEDNRKIKLEEK